MFSVIYHQLFRTRLFRIPRYFELIVLSLHLKSTPLFRTCQKQSTYMRAQLETYCILIWVRTEHTKIFQCNSICWFIRHIMYNILYNILYFYLISVFLHTVLYFIKKWFIVTNFTLPRLFRNPAISNFFRFPLGLQNSGVQLYFFIDKKIWNSSLLTFYQI